MVDYFKFESSRIMEAYCKDIITSSECDYLASLLNIEMITNDMTRSQEVEQFKNQI